MDRPTPAKPDILGGRLGQNVTGIRQRAGQSVQLGHYEGVSRPSAGCGCSLESGPVPVRARQAVVDLDAVITDVESTQGISLCGAILLIQ